MKKMLISVIALSISAMAMATKTASVRVNLVGSNATYSVSTLRLVEDDARTAAAENGYDASCIMSQANENSTLIYGLIGTAEYSTIYTNDLTGLKLGFVTNQVDQDYTLTFTNFSGNEFSLYDKVADKYITINATTPAYAFSVETAQVGRVAINDRFEIKEAPAGPEFCFANEELKVNGFAGKKLAIWNADKTTAIVPEFTLGDTYTKDFSGEAANSKFIIVFDGLPATAPAQKEYVIDVKPAVTTVNP